MPTPVPMDPVRNAQSAGVNSGLRAQDFIEFATNPQFLKTRYVDHATIPNWGPGTGWDCSSFTSYVMKQYGVDLPAYSDSQYKMGTPVEKNDLQPGDLVFFHTSDKKVTGHVGIYIGGGKMVNAANPRSGTVIQSINSGNQYVGARRYLSLSGTHTAPKPTPGNTATHELAGDSPTMTAQFGADAGMTLDNSHDHLDLNDAAAVAGFDMDFVKAHKGILRVFQQAADEDWFTSGEVGKAKFQAAFNDTTWAKANGPYAQAYLLAAAKNGGKDKTFLEQQKTAEEFVREAALRVGAKLDDHQLKFFAKQTLMNGWNVDATRAHFLDQALTGQLEFFDPKTGRKDLFQTDHLNYEAGATAKTIQDLKESAYKNGVTYNESWYRGAARSVAGGLSTLDDHLQEIRKQASSLFPVYADKVAAGADVMDLASPYINKMAQTLEIDPNSIGLNDPTIKKALGGVDTKGNPSAVGLWDFEKSLRQDSRWQYTKQANDEISNLTSKIISMFGMGG